MVNLYYSNRTVQNAIELKNRRGIWLKAQSATLSSGQNEVKFDFPLPITACNIVLEFAEFYTNTQVGGAGGACESECTYVSVLVCAFCSTHSHHPCLLPLTLSLPPYSPTSFRPVQRCSTVLAVVPPSLPILVCVGSVGRTSSSVTSVGEQTQHAH